MVKSIFYFFLLCCLCLVTGCASHKTHNRIDAEATLVNGAGLKIGTIQLSNVAGGVKIKAHVSQLSPGLHGFHIHEKGVCEGPAFKSAGGHFNPMGHEHGTHNPRGFHMGDLPNLEINAQGEGNLTFLIKSASLKNGGGQSLLKEGGTAFIIHKNPDDYVSSPSGNAGSRIGCGVIKSTL